MTVGKSFVAASLLTIGAAAAAMAVDAIWMLHQAARGVPGENPSIDFALVAEDIFSVKGLLIGAVIFLFLFSIARIWTNELRG
ncbi:MAG TPA: hypothetical protein VL913_00130 [Candidatus Micrarchaeaceae archaeon]|nr:hypothetical protein [Candidatus Micrarchaeaceae archaeon]